jgi:hypothetical protein
VLEALIDGEDDELAGAGERAVVQQARQVRERAGVLGRVPREDLSVVCDMFSLARILGADRMTRHSAIAIT